MARNTSTNTHSRRSAHAHSYPTRRAPLRAHARARTRALTAACTPQYLDLAMPHAAKMGGIAPRGSVYSQSTSTRDRVHICSDFGSTSAQDGPTYVQDMPQSRSASATADSSVGNSGLDCIVGRKCSVGVEVGVLRPGGGRWHESGAAGVVLSGLEVRPTLLCAASPARIYASATLGHHVLSAT